jgi:hypothetical protein
MSNRLTRTLGLAVILLPLGCGGGVDVNTDYDPGADFASFSTYTWAVRTNTGDDDPRVYNRVTAQRVKTAVDRALRAKGYTEEGTDGDFLVAWHGAIEGQMSYQTITSHYGYGWGWYGDVGMSRTYVNEWDEGTVLVDIVDANSRELVWRGTATGTVQQRSSPQQAQADLDAAAKQLLSDFPPGR